ncbi:MFS transporter [Rivibacter subsaxonicus]|uniref:Putative MFS family arabinose efflux permease n=1 Tax=Rivibacter subsaxonicus TaxID=457575 RepID=A0A4Q7VDT5_9BURK|nr:MFS transporter [Rivibacter subsaxonicus]RZT93633.1 putative MFS family arabinose efflux permease [Rivibacter subsaxonicus]
MSAAAVASSRWALLFGNFVIGCGLMVVAGSLNDLTRSLEVSVAVGGQLIAIAAVVMCVAAPLLAGLVSGFDRRVLLALALLWYGVGHAVSALAPNYAALVPLRAISMLAAAVFTPQAAAAMGFIAAPAERGRAITFIFLGWSVASVFGMPLHAWIGESFGWRWAFALVALLSLVGAAWVWRAMPAGIRPPALGAAAWRETLTNPVLMAVIGVTALQGAGQFTLFSYFAPYYRQVLGASPLQISLLFGWFGLFGLVGNVILSRNIDRIGPPRAVFWLMLLITTSLLLWPLATTVGTVAIVVVPWALGCFAANSAQQARLGAAAPALAPALMALNSSAIYLGQAAGAASGGLMLAGSGYSMLAAVGIAWMVAALVLSRWAQRRGT